MNCRREREGKDAMGWGGLSSRRGLAPLVSVTCIVAGLSMGTTMVPASRVALLRCHVAAGALPC